MIDLKDFPGAKELTPLEMNAIHFNTGRHSPIEKTPPTESLSFRATESLSSPLADPVSSRATESLSSPSADPVSSRVAESLSPSADPVSSRANESVLSPAGNTDVSPAPAPARKAKFNLRDLR